MILQSQLEVNECDSDERGDDEQHDKGQEKDPKQRVNLVPPHTGKYVVELNIDGAERKKSCHEHLGVGLAVPRDVRGDFPGHFVGSARNFHDAGRVSADDTSQHSQRERNQKPHRHNRQNSVPGEGSS
mmetsp:Transcript_13532/g.17821  ORF Transcript_13532/g.17821 Transcript_13532/m.17821 type:complete len:128 (-) Transcript_13532:664-1047(-)